MGSWEKKLIEQTEDVNAQQLQDNTLETCLVQT